MAFLDEWSRASVIMILTALFAFLAAAISPLLSAIKINDEIELATKMAGEFTALRDRFRRLATGGSLTARASNVARVGETRG